MSEVLLIYILVHACLMHLAKITPEEASDGRA